MQGDAIKDATGRPPNIRPPRNRWMWAVYKDPRHVFEGYEPLRWWAPCRLHVRRQAYAAIRSRFTPGSFTHQYWSWRIVLVTRVGVLVLWRWRERWAD